MALVDSLRTTTVRPTRLVALLQLLIIASCFSLSNLTASPTFLPAPVSEDLPQLTISSERTHTFIVNGAFDNDFKPLTFSAFQTNGNPLPSWAKLDEQTGTFQFKAPSSASGDVLTIRVLGTDSNGSRAIEQFDLIVDDVSLGCSLEANTDGLTRILDCDTGTTKLRGYSSTGSYKWTGPNGFSSSEKEPTVRYAGLYVLKTSGCNRTQAVYVLNSESGCNTADKNKLPEARIDADEFSGNAPFTVNFDALLSSDSDGKIIDYQWSWGDVTAAGPTPTATFSEGSHNIVLTVTDNTGAKSTDYVTVEVSNSDYVRYREFWLEAECAQVGGAFATEGTSSASGSKYVGTRSSSIDRAPADVPENRIRFVINDAEKGSYNLYARAEAFDSGTDSYWVRVNGKSWFFFRGLTAGKGFQWNEMSEYQPYLNDGTNIIDFAFREPRVRLDKLHLNKQQSFPSGTGQNASNCNSSANQAPRAVARVSKTSGIAPLTVSFDGSSSTDSDGTIRNYRWSWNGGSKDAKQADMTLDAGRYDVTLTVTDDDGASNSDAVTILVEDQPTASGDAIWLEAECGIVGNSWTHKKSSGASNGEYVVVTDQNSHSSAPSDIKDNRVRFLLDVAQGGNYNLFAHISAPSNLDDSFWVRANGGPWFKWYSGIKQGSGFSWNKMGSKVALNRGANTLDIAFREDGTMLDKLFLTATNAEPSGMGSSATNCGGMASPDDSDVASDFSEAECSPYGATWETRNSSDASQGVYLIATGMDYFSTPSSSHTNDFITFRTYANGSGRHYLHLRVDVTFGTNSCWVKIDDQPWRIFATGEDGGEIRTPGFEWRTLASSGNAVGLPLDAGYHTVVIAKRDVTFKLDKVVLSKSADAPSGQGGDAGNCGEDAMAMGSPAMLLNSETTEDELEYASGITLYPNPVVDLVNLTLNDEYSGEVDLFILDVNGREIQSVKREKESELLTVEFNVSNLPAGVYNVRIIEGEEQSVQSFIKQ